MAARIGKKGMISPVLNTVSMLCHQKELWVYLYDYNHSTDGGSTWFSISNMRSGTPQDVEIVDSFTAWILYNDDQNEDGRDVVRYTTDGGRSFNRELYLDSSVECYGIDVVASGQGDVIWAAGKNGLLLRYREIQTAVKQCNESECAVSVSPNPANISTTIRYSLPEPSHVTLEVFSISGQKIETLVDNHMSAGLHTVRFDGSSFASGIYLYRFGSNNYTATGKILLMK